MLPSFKLLLANLTNSNTAEIAFAVLQSSSIASSNLVIYSFASSNNLASASVTFPSLPLEIISLIFAPDVIILSSPFFADSIRSSLKLSGLL